MMASSRARTSLLAGRRPDQGLVGRGGQGLCLSHRPRRQALCDVQRQQIRCPLLPRSRIRQDTLAAGVLLTVTQRAEMSGESLGRIGPVPAPARSSRAIECTPTASPAMSLPLGPFRQDHLAGQCPQRDRLHHADLGAGLQPDHRRRSAPDPRQQGRPRRHGPQQEDRQGRLGRRERPRRLCQARGHRGRRQKSRSSSSAETPSGVSIFQNGETLWKFRWETRFQHQRRHPHLP